MWFRFNKVENTVAKGENAGYKQLTLDQQARPRSFIDRIPVSRLRPVFTNHSKECSLSFSPRFVNWNMTQLLIG